MSLSARNRLNGEITVRCLERSPHWLPSR